MKKIYLLMFLFVFLLLTVSSAQNLGIENNISEVDQYVDDNDNNNSIDNFDMMVSDIVVENLDDISGNVQVYDDSFDTDDVSDSKDIIKNIDQSKITKAEVAELLRYLDLGFCDNGVDNMTYTLNKTLTAGVSSKVCLMAINNSDIDVKLNLDFSDAGLDNLGGLVCLAPQNFKNNIVNADAISGFVVPAKNYIVIEPEILYPIGTKSNQAGCFAIWIDGEQNNREGDEGGMFFPVISRIGALANFYVGSLGDIKNELNISNLKTSVNENGELILTFDVNNLGNLENKIAVDGKLSNILGFSKTYSSDQLGVEANVLPGGSKSIEVNMGLIPNYGGLFNIEFEVTGTPYFSYELSDDFDKSLLEPLTYTEKTTYFEMPWLIAIIIVVVIILLIVLFRKPKPQVVYVQAPQQPQQPQPQYQQPQYQNPQYQQPVNNQVPQQPQYQQPQQPMQQ